MENVSILTAPLFKYKDLVPQWPTLEVAQTIPKEYRSRFTSGRGTIGLGLVLAIVRVLMGMAGGFFEPTRTAWTAYPDDPIPASVCAVSIYLEEKKDERTPHPRTPAPDQSP
ncbi:hypothetical protein [Anthocerotibacter panamensis]|uniref:hypothetical protein n=1 Tax=Anthocerotibacter panamensis TaxID=2857077 RepID=UPI001C4063F5|nr:hypothetical protein [Anthocerotibacter panamensis]